MVSQFSSFSTSTSDPPAKTFRQVGMILDGTVIDSMVVGGPAFNTGKREHRSRPTHSLIHVSLGGEQPERHFAPSSRVPLVPISRVPLRLNRALPHAHRHRVYPPLHAAA
jgi:hypothetical protein